MSILVLAALTAALAATEPAACPWESLLGDTALGMSDRNATYGWAWFEVKPGERIEVRGRFPHARYLSYVVQDQDGTVIDALDDVAIDPDAGRNPFRPGESRNAPDLGTYAIKVSPDAPPPGRRPANTLYAGRDHKGETNRLILLNLRIYLPDKAYGRDGGNADWKTGGVPAPKIRLIGSEGVALPCPTPGVARAAWRARQPTTAQQTLNVPAVPGQTPAENPPRWFHSSRVGNRTTNLLGPNDSTVYASTPLSTRFGRVVELRWRPPASPTGTSLGGPFPKRSEMRYWSLSFMYADPKAKDFGGIRTERTVADYEIPRDRAGEAHLFIGLGGVARPAGVRPQEWLGLTLSEGVMMLRETLIAPDYAGDLGRIERGYVPASLSASVPSVTYRSDQAGP